MTQQQDGIVDQSENDVRWTRQVIAVDDNDRFQYGMQKE